MPDADLTGYSYLECRSLGHAWTILGWYTSHDGDPRRKVRCSRCHTVRTDKVLGYTRSRSYGYPGDYRLEDRPTPMDLWEAHRLSHKVFESEDALDAAARRRSDAAAKRRRR